jgi:hypothetical protein
MRVGLAASHKSAITLSIITACKVGDYLEINLIMSIRNAGACVSPCMHIQLCVPQYHSVAVTSLVCGFIPQLRHRACACASHVGNQGIAGVGDMRLDPVRRHIPIVFGVCRSLAGAAENLEGAGH